MKITYFTSSSQRLTEDSIQCYPSRRWTVRGESLESVVQHSFGSVHLTSVRPQGRLSGSTPGRVSVVVGRLHTHSSEKYLIGGRRLDGVNCGACRTYSMETS